MKYGGVLHTKIPFDLNSFNLPKNNNEIKNKINFHLSYNYPNIKSILRKLFFKQPNYFPDKPEAIIDDFILDDYSINIIKKTNWNILKSYKYENLNLSDMKFNNVGTTSTNSTHFKKIFKTILTFIYIQIPNFEIQKKLKDFYMPD